MDSERGETVTLESLTRAQWNGLATICLVLLIELAVSTEWLLRLFTGRAWNAYSLAVAFLIVCWLREPLARWIWTSKEEDAGCRLKKDCEPGKSSVPAPAATDSAPHAG